MVCSFWNLKQFCNHPPNISKSIKKMLQSNGKWARYALSKWRGLCFGFFSKLFSMILKHKLFNYCFFIFSLKFFYNRFWDIAFVAFESSKWMKNKQNIIARNKGGLKTNLETKYHSFSSRVLYFVLFFFTFKEYL
jgi:hypothetical protein